MYKIKIKKKKEVFLMKQSMKYYDENLPKKKKQKRSTSIDSNDVPTHPNIHFLLFNHHLITDFVLSSLQMFLILLKKKNE